MYSMGLMAVLLAGCATDGEKDARDEPSVEGQSVVDCTDGLDNDGDGLTDCEEEDCLAIVPACCPDADSDGVCDADDQYPGINDNLDSDADGVPNGCDICPGFNDLLDADLDTVPDGCDICPLGDDSADADTDGVESKIHRRAGDVDGKSHEKLVNNLPPSFGVFAHA